MDEVFRALADPTRRRLLDALFAEDAQTLSALEGRCDMTRQGVMKHLRVLEEAGLVTTRRSGREKRHHLNAVPIRQLYERWVSKYSEPWAATLTGLKTKVEEQMAEKVFVIHIRATAERVWDSLVSGEMTERYYHGSVVHSDWKPGSAIEYRSPDGTEVWVRGEVAEAHPPARLVHSFEKRWDDEGAEPPSRVTWEIVQEGDVCRVTVLHDGLIAGGALEGSISEGWPFILSGLKTLLETGEPLAVDA